MRRELEAYEAAFELLASGVAALESAGVFPAKMPREQLLAICRARDLFPPAETTDAALRGYVKTLLGRAPRTAAELEAYLKGLGCAATLTENADGTLTLTGGATGVLFDTARLTRLLARLLPAGLTFLLDFGVLTWGMLDGAGFTAAALDAKNFTWAWFDQNGHLLLGEG